MEPTLIAEHGHVRKRRMACVHLIRACEVSVLTTLRATSHHSHVFRPERRNIFVRLYWDYTGGCSKAHSRGDPRLLQVLYQRSAAGSSLQLR